MQDHLIRIYESELDLIVDETSDHSDIETGGNVFGLFSHGGDPTVLLATRPTRQAVHQKLSLELDAHATAAMEAIAWERFGVQCLGMWHSHHWIGLFEPSQGDCERTRRYGRKYQRPRYVEIIANFSSEPRAGRARQTAREVLVTPFFYLDSASLERANTEFQVLPGESPLRRAVEEMEQRDGLRDMLRPAARKLRVGRRVGFSTATWQDRSFSDSPDCSALSVRPVDLAQDDFTAAEPALSNSGEPDTSLDRELEAAHSPQPISDLAAYFASYIQPLVAQLPPAYNVEAAPLDRALGFELVVKRALHAARLTLLLAWDGSRPMAFSCRVDAGSRRAQPAEWIPLRPTERYELSAPLAWGLGQLDQML